MKPFVPLMLLATLSCSPLPPVPFFDADALPPAIAALRLPSPKRLEVEFSESIGTVSEPIVSDSVGAPAVLHSPDARLVTFEFDEAPSPTTMHSIEAQVADLSRNELRFIINFHGLNPVLPAMLINEFTTQGSGNNPDLVELRVLSSGNLAGATLFEGTPENWKQRFVFPSVDVQAGDYVVVHFKPDGDEQEINETKRKDRSAGKNATDTAWDFWVPEGAGLSGNNGVLSLCENPLGGYLDVVLYSNRTSESDERYRGFGTKDVMERADSIHAAGAWKARGAQVAPEDAINPDPSTSTRSMARGSDGEDTNSASDWHTTPTRGLTPGAINTDEVHVP